MNELKYDEKIIVEKVIENLKELNCSVLGDKDLYKPSLIEEVSGKDNILSYEDKYISGGKSKTANAKLSKRRFSRATCWSR
jgi:D-alanine-D-alanine ligase